VPAATIPAGQQADGPSIARIYDYLLGGSHNFPADQHAAGEFLARRPDVPETMRANRAFPSRAVRYLVGEADIRQSSTDEPAALVTELREALAPGSFVVISHGTTDGQAPGVAEAMSHHRPVPTRAATPR
jgi:hypothetical protein